MRSITVRLGIVVAMVVLVHLGFSVVGVDNEVQLPARSVNEFPLQWGAWQGKSVELDPKVFARTGAHETADRKYQDPLGREVSLHFALFTRFAEGLLHSPMNCYRDNGWSLIEESRVPVKVANRPDINVSVSTWELKGEKALVLYWYELGDHVLYGRGDLATVVWDMRSRPKWPPMYKVLLQTTATDAESRAKLLEIAAGVRQWIGPMEPSASVDRSDTAQTGTKATP